MYHTIQCEIELGEILLNGWKNRFVLHEDGNLNLSKVLVSKNDSDDGNCRIVKRRNPSEKKSIIPVKVDTRIHAKYPYGFY